MSCYRTISVRYASLLEIVKLLRSSVSSVNTRVLDELVEGINVNEKVTIDCRTPLHLAASIKCENTSLTALKVILHHAANPNIPNEEGNTALHIAASLGHRYALRLLICNGGDLLQCNIKGETPIDVAFSAGFPNVSSHLSKLLDAESFETSSEPKFKKFLWNRQLREVSSNFRESVPLAASCSLCSKSFNIRKTAEAFSGFSTIEMEKSNLSSTSRTLLQASKSRLISSSVMDSTRDGDEFNIFLSHLNECYLNLSRESTQQNIIDKDNVDRCIMAKEKVDELAAKRVLNFENKPSDASRILFPGNAKEVLSGNHSKFSQNSQITSEHSNDCFVTALTSICCSNKCASSNLTVVEEYIYKDDNGVELVERIYPPTLNITGTSVSLFSERSEMDGTKTLLEAKSKEHEQDSVGTLTESILGLSGEELRMKLKEMGFIAGPITSNTFRALQRHFQRLRRNKARQSLNKPIMIRYSRELEYICNNLSISLTHYEELELKMCEPFIAPDELSCWRSGIQKNCFNYLLLDPRISRNLPLRKNSFPVKDLFRNFLNSVFYIGKGSRARPYYHLYEALSDTSKSPKNKSKLLKIKEIWNEGLGVVSLHIFQNSIPVESWTREACMIAAFGPDNLCNRIQGTFYGPASTWRKKDQRELGSFCLFKAFNLLLFEGERQIRPRDVSIPKWLKKD